MLFLEWSSLKKTGTGRAKNVRKNGVCKKVLTFFFFLIAICWSSFVSCCVHLEEQSLWHCLTYSWNKPKFNFILCDFLKNLCGCCVRSYFPWVGKQKAVWHFGCGRHWVKLASQCDCLMTAHVYISIICNIHLKINVSFVISVVTHSYHVYHTSVTFVK